MRWPFETKADTDVRIFRDPVTDEITLRLVGPICLPRPDFPILSISITLDARLDKTAIERLYGQLKHFAGRDLDVEQQIGLARGDDQVNSEVDAYTSNHIEIGPALRTDLRKYERQATEGQRQRVEVVAQIVASKVNEPALNVAEEILQVIERNSVVGFAYTRPDNSVIVSSVHETREAARLAGGEGCLVQVLVVPLASSSSLV
jgi:hypothetical protein